MITSYYLTQQIAYILSSITIKWLCRYNVLKVIMLLIKFLSLNKNKFIDEVNNLWGRNDFI